MTTIEQRCSPLNIAHDSRTPAQAPFPGSGQPVHLSMQGLEWGDELLLACCAMLIVICYLLFVICA